MKVCKHCGSTVYKLAFVDYNTNEYDSDLDGTDIYCDNCGKLFTFEIIDKYEYREEESSGVSIRT